MPAGRSSPTAWMTSRDTIAPTSSSWSTGTRCYPVGCCASTTRTSSRISRGACGGCSSSASCPSSRRASSTTAPRAASARRAPSRCVSRSSARVVVIGGGVVGCSVLYHLTKGGWKDVVLVERDQLTSGSTWHAAGGFHTLNGDPKVAKLQGDTIRIYDELERS